MQQMVLSKMVLLISLMVCLSCASSQLVGAKSHDLHALPKSSLNAFIQQALETNPAIQSANANVEAARSRHLAAGQPLYNPSLVADGQKATDTFYSVGINQTIDWRDKRGAREQVELANVQAAETQRIVVYQQLMADILNALARYESLKKVVTLANERASLLKQLVELTQKRYENGDVARVDVDLASLALSEALAQEADAKVNLIQAIQSLRTITGQQKANWPTLPTPLPNFNLIRFNTKDLVNHLPIVQVLNNRFLSLKARIQLAEQERYPDPTIGVQGGQEKTDGQNGGLVGVSLSVPLFIRNNYKAEVDIAHYDAIEVEKSRLDMIRRMHAEIEGSAERYQILFETVQQWQAISNKPLKEGMMLIKNLWQAGEITTTDYIVQLKQRIDSQIAEAELGGRAWQAWIEWLKASGTVETWVKNGKIK